MSVPGSGAGVVVDTSVQRVLVYRLGSLGDTLVALPSLHLIEQAFPNAHRRMLTNIPVASRAPAAAAVLGDSGLIHSYQNYPVGTRSPWQLLSVLWSLRRFRPQVAVYLKAVTDPAIAQRDALFLRWAGVRRIVGLPSTVCDSLLAEESAGTLEPEADRLARSIGVLGNAHTEQPQSWDLRLSASERTRAAEALRPLQGRGILAVSVGTKVQAKDWGTGNWGQLLHALAVAYPGYGLLLAGAAEESAASERASIGWRSASHAGPVVNACGLLSPREAAAAFESADLFIGHDSGPMHLAAAVGTPTVSIFAARNKPRTWFPVGAANRVLYHRVDCWGCGLETCIEQRKKCLLSITVDEVLQAVQTMMKSVTPRSTHTQRYTHASMPEPALSGGEVHAA